MQFPGAGAKPAVGIIFDSDFGNRIDEVLALALLYGLDGKNETRVVSVSSTMSDLKSAALIDAMIRFYTMGFSRTLPVGLAADGRIQGETKLLAATTAHQNSIKTINDTAECAALIRNALTAQHDQNAIVVLAGPATNLVKSMALPGVNDLIKSKVRSLVISTTNLHADASAASKLLAEWPGPVVAVGKEVGEAMPFPGTSIEKDFAWATTPHPVVDAYRAYKAMPYDAPASTMAAILYAVRPKETYFKVSEPGTLKVTNAGVEFTPAAGGTHSYLLPDPAQKERVIKTYVELVSAKPTPRRPRFFPQQQQQQVQPPKPNAPKPPTGP
jgi:hypothetical protein